MRLLGLLLIASCATDPDHTIDITFDPCAAHHLAPSDALAAELASIQHAQQLWLAVLPLAAVDDPTTPEIAIRFEAAAPAFRGIYLDEEGEIVINRELVDDEMRAVTIAHELGHAFGLPHVEDRASVMNPGNLAVRPTAEDASMLFAIWPRCTEAPQVVRNETATTQ